MLKIIGEPSAVLLPQFQCLLHRLSCARVILDSCASNWTEADGNSADVSTSRQQLFILLIYHRSSVVFLVIFHSGLSLRCLQVSVFDELLVVCLYMCVCAIFAGRQQFIVKRRCCSRFSCCDDNLSDKCVQLKQFILNEDKMMRLKLRK